MGNNWSQSGHKTARGTVSIVNYNERIRLRWSYQSIRYSLNLAVYNKANLLHAKKTALQIESDILNGTFDSTLNKYKYNNVIIKSVVKTVVEYFEEWTINYRQMNCEKNTDYNSLR